ncbi:hypothetical protein ACFY0A_37755 [Streptomyces sp. NPDC001698]|uniref:hypothetical protein n=1 Tax=Streptomyces sp. NPDC001698 TaxID=3364601 RepID=UPI0036A4C41B
MGQVTDLRAVRREDVTAEHKRQAAQVLATVAKRYEEDEPGSLADGLGFVTRISAAAYDVTGRTLAGAHRIVAAVAREAAPEVEGTTRGELAAGLLEAARAMGWSDDSNGPAIPRHPVPGPRESSESGRVPAPRPEQFAGVAR